MTIWIEILSRVVAYAVIVLLYGIGLGVSVSLAYLVFSLLTGVTL